MCRWLLDSMNGAMRVLESGGTMPWLHEGTPYTKVIDLDGVTTEFIRCRDPTDSGIVVKITRTATTALAGSRQPDDRSLHRHSLPGSLDQQRARRAGRAAERVDHRAHWHVRHVEAVYAQ
jgi:hypothetical protein